MTTLVLILALSLAMPALAGKPDNGDGGGKKGGGKSKGGSGFNAEGADQLPLTITFDDASGDLMKSDSALYVDSDIPGAPDANLAAHILVGSSGNYGNLYLMTSNTVDRAVSMDISDCHADCDDQPFSSDSLPVALTVIATEAVSSGFCGMGNGDTITAPMEITYNLDGVEQPGFIYFNPGIKGKSPCRGTGTSDEVSVERVDDVTWRVMGSAACVIKPGGRDAGGQVNMPFGFTIDASASCN
jgi:hypothetical protein